MTQNINSKIEYTNNAYPTRFWRLHMWSKWPSWYLVDALPLAWKGILCSWPNYGRQFVMWSEEHIKFTLLTFHLPQGWKWGAESEWVITTELPAAHGYYVTIACAQNCKDKAIQKMHQQLWEVWIEDIELESKGIILPIYKRTHWVSFRLSFSILTTSLTVKELTVTWALSNWAHLKL